MLAGTDSPSSSRALVTTGTQAPDAPSHRPVRRVASFLTQLLANTGRLPQAREKRRADPVEVIAAYRATVERLQNLNDKSE